MDADKGFGGTAFPDAAEIRTGWKACATNSS